MGVSAGNHRFFGGKDLAVGLLIHNFVTGCTILVDAKTAKDAISFCPYMIHDHYLALYCAACGRLDSFQSPTICYWQHGSNQTGLMCGVKDKVSYERLQIDESIKKFRWLQENFSCSAELLAQIARCLAWMEMRKQYWRKKNGKRTLWRYRDCEMTITLFELLAVHFPEKLFMWIIDLNQKNIIRKFQ